MKKSLQNLPKEVRLPKNPFLSVIIPAYNEVENFKRGVLDQIRNYFGKVEFLWEVVLVDDGSTDATGKLLENFVAKYPGFRLVKKEHGGKLKAIEAGVNVAKGKVLLFTDFDQSTPISEFKKFLPKFETGADIVIGNRVGKGAKRLNDPPFRYIRSRILNFLVKILLFGGISDTQCGFKAGKAEILRRLFKNLKVTNLRKPTAGFMGPWDVELLFLAKKAKFKIVEVPVTWQYFPSKRLSVFSEPLEFLIDILKIKLFDISGRYISGAPLRGR